MLKLSTIVSTRKKPALYLKKVRQKLLEVNGWLRVAGALCARFQLVDNKGHGLDRDLREGDFLKIDIPGPAARPGKDMTGSV